MGTEFLKARDISQVEIILQKLFEKLYTETKSEEVRLDQALFRVLSDDIHASINIPPFDRTLRDGFAVKVQDTFNATEENPVTLKILEVIEAGDVPQKEIKNGFCSEISTGAPIPPGADGVVMIEYSQKEGDKVHLFKTSYPGQFIALKGSDIEKGELVLKKGTILSPEKIGVLSALGFSKIKVKRKMKIAIVSTGNELLSAEKQLDYGKIYDVNSLALRAALKTYGTNPVIKGIVPDKYQALKDTIKNSLNDFDLIITSGGTSAGAGDVLRLVLDDLGKVLVHGITMKPGKPTIIGEIDHKLIVGLPGNPSAALIVLDVLLAPHLKSYSGFTDKASSKINLPLSTRFHSSKGRIQYVLIKIVDNKVYPILKDSGAIHALVEADGYITIPKNVELIAEGTNVDVILFDDFSINLS